MLFIHNMAIDLRFLCYLATYGATKLKGKIDGEEDPSDVDYSIYDFDKDYIGLFLRQY